MFEKTGGRWSLFAGMRPPGLGRRKLAPEAAMPPYQQLDPFLSASAGGVQGGFQPYINKLSNQATQALNGGLLDTIPQALQPGNAGGTPEQIADPRLRGLLAQGFAPREWNR